MNITAIFASPRQNSASKAFGKYFLNRIAEKSTVQCNIDTFTLGDMQYGGCKACYLCQTEEELGVCKETDDLIEVFASLRKADILFMATPIYFGNLPSQLKAFTDRCKQFFMSTALGLGQISSLPSGKILVMLTTQQVYEVTKYEKLRKLLHYFFKQLGFTDFYFIGEDLLSIEFDLNEHKTFYNIIDNCIDTIINPADRL
ncbi:MAG: flavodoxin family protein [Spirochaetaceae bacterium]|nr:flavodoxin family protein [Spirochaetaceae bacterium]